MRTDDETHRGPARPSVLDHAARTGTKQQRTGSLSLYQQMPGRRGVRRTKVAQVPYQDRHSSMSMRRCMRIGGQARSAATRGFKSMAALLTVAAAGSSLLLTACGSLTNPAPPGTVELAIAMPHQPFVIDGNGRSVQVTGASLALATPALSHVGGADCGSGGCTLPDNSVAPIVSLRPGQRHDWARWTSASEAGSRLRLGLASVDSRHWNELAAGAAVSVSVSYMNPATGTPLFFQVQLAVDTAWARTLAGSEMWDERGGRYEMEINPTAWLIDRHGFVRPLEELIATDPSVNSGRAVGRAVIEAMLTDLEVRRVD